MSYRGAAKTARIDRILWLVVVLALVPAAVLAVRRVAAESSKEQVAIVMDEQALGTQGDLVGLTSLELGLRYKASGLTGVALYEDTIETLAAKGYAATLLGSELKAQLLASGEPAPPIPSNATLVTALLPGALDDLIAKNVPQARSFELDGRTWYLWPGDVKTVMPAGPDTAQLRLWKNAGFDIAYRPRNAPYSLVGAGSDFPDEATYLVHAGTQVAGWPFGLDDVEEASAGYYTAVIEGTPQNGMADLSGKVPTVRLLSFNQDYVDRRLRPADLIDKYLLAVEERNVRLLYLRPYTTVELGDPIENTEKLVAGLTRSLAAQGYVVGPLSELGTSYVTQAWLRALAALGVAAGVLLLARRFPAPWGAAALALVVLAALFFAGPSWDAVALLAALVFPTLGYLTFKERLPAILGATAVSLAGALLLAAVGSERETLLAIRPFSGVGLTLVVPPALFLAAYLLRQHRPAVWVKRMLGTRITFGHVALGLLALAAVAVVVLRRGNDPVIGVSQFELTLRSLLGEFVARPRFKELLGHPLALIALAVPGWPAWLRGLLLTGGVVAQASILNSFSHYHTPLLISLERTGVALLVGLVIGAVFAPLAALATRVIGRWLAEATDEPTEAPGT
ncbi:MAG TPA: DUF5693 family protein [Trueperaceae bacterium]|nr:DUF5693 family protein [Trueperaceae bacterium]